MTLSQQTKSQLKWRPWIFLIVHAPLFIFFAYKAAGFKRDDFLDYVTAFLVPLLNGWLIAEGSLAAWAEGYSNELELCENGILFTHKFFDWSSSKIRSIAWSENGKKLLVNINRTLITVHVAPHQCEAVDAILESYFKDRIVATDQT